MVCHRERTQWACGGRQTRSPSKKNVMLRPLCGDQVSVYFLAGHVVVFKTLPRSITLPTRKKHREGSYFDYPGRRASLLLAEPEIDRFEREDEGETNETRTQLVGGLIAVFDFPYCLG